MALTVKQLVVYQSTVMVHKTLLTSNPYYLHSKLNMEYSYRTRQQTGGGISSKTTHSDSGVTVQGTASDVQELTPINTIKQGHL